MFFTVDTIINHKQGSREAFKKICSTKLSLQYMFSSRKTPNTMAEFILQTVISVHINVNYQRPPGNKMMVNEAYVLNVKPKNLYFFQDFI